MKTQVLLSKSNVFMVFKNAKRKCWNHCFYNEIAVSVLRFFFGNYGKQWFYIVKPLFSGLINAFSLYKQWFSQPYFALLVFFVAFFVFFAFFLNLLRLGWAGLDWPPQPSRAQPPSPVYPSPAQSSPAEVGAGCNLQFLKWDGDATPTFWTEQGIPPPPSEMRCGWHLHSL